ncbi:hypothetical protein JCM6882_009323 [Rhodosporidiobolus microsporus]
MGNKDLTEEDVKGKKRIRKAASCNPCRSRRIRCDRGRPCAACIGRNDEKGCIWDSNALPPLFERREANETESLKSEVDRLQRLVDVLVSARPSSDLDDSLPLPPPPPYPPFMSTSTPSPPAIHLEHVDTHGTALVLEEEDVIKKLSGLTIKTFHLPSQREAASSETLVQEAQDLLDAKAPTPDAAGNLASSVPGEALSLFPTATSPTTLQELVGRVPPKNLVAEARDAYFAGVCWCFHPFTRWQYDEHERAVFEAKDADKPAPAGSLAIIFAVCALGLAASKDVALPFSQYNKNDLAEKLVELARASLAVARFVEEPSLDGIRALILIAYLHAVFAPGDDGGRGMGLFALAANACFQLDLHRDPDKLPRTFSVFEAEDRRRLFWNVVVGDVSMTAIVGRRFSLLRPQDCDTRFPLDIHDEQMLEENPVPTGEETRITAAIMRMRFAKIAAQVTEEVFGIEPVAYSRVLAFDAQLRALHAEVPETYQIVEGEEGLAWARSFYVNFSILHEILRLHRPYLPRSFYDDKFLYSRTACVEAARAMLALHDSPSARSCWGAMMCKGVTSATVLCIVLMYAPDSADAAADRERVAKAISHFDAFGNMSTICRRGATLLRFLLDKIDAAARSFRPNDDDAPLSKRTRASSPFLAPSAPLPDAPSEPTLAHKPSYSSLASSASHSPGAPAPSHLPNSSPRPILPYPTKRPRTSSRLSTSPESTSGSLPSRTEKASSLAPRLLSTNVQTKAKRQAAHELADLNIAQLLGADGTFSPTKADAELAALRRDLKRVSDAWGTDAEEESSGKGGVEGGSEGAKRAKKDKGKGKETQTQTCSEEAALEDGDEGGWKTSGWAQWLHEA